MLVKFHGDHILLTALRKIYIADITLAHIHSLYTTLAFC